jgi:hypothetical protein
MSKLSFKILGKKRGGGGGTSTTSTLPEWAEPYIKNILNTNEATFGTGALSGVAGLNANQQAAFGSGAELLAHAGVEGTNDLINQKARLNNVAQTGGFDTQPYKNASNEMMRISHNAAQTGGFNINPYTQGAQQQQQQVANLASSGGFLKRPMPTTPPPVGAEGGGLIGPTDNPYLQTALNQENRLGAHATSGGYDPQGVVDAAVLEGGMRTADMGRQYGQAGTLGSARQGVQQASQNAATTAAVAGIRQGAAQQNFQNKMAAEGMMGNNLQQQLGIGQQDFQNRMAGTQLQSNLLGQQFGFDQQNFQNRMTGTQLGSSLMGQQFGFDQQNFQNRMTGEQGVGQNVAGTSQLAGNTASGLANLGNQQRTAVQQQLDSPYQALQRYASTAYGNPARQQTVASGGK